MPAPPSLDAPAPNAPAPSAPTSNAPTSNAPAPAVDAGRCRAWNRPARATRVGFAPRPRMRPLGDVLAELVRPVAAPGGPLGGPLDDLPDGTPAAPPAPTSGHADDPATRPVVLRLLQAVVEVLDGVRPAAHLRRACDEAVPTAAVLAHVVRPGARTPRGRLRGVRVCAVAPHTLEAAGVVHRGDRARALAARLEHDGTGWRFTALTLL